VIANPETRQTLLSKLRAEGGFGIDADISAESEATLLAEFEKERASYVRQYNPDEILEFISSIPHFDLREEFDPGSSTIAEMETRLRELRYRKDWLEALLYITKEELKLFEGAR
jgi:hypothetical protein